MYMVLNKFVSRRWNLFWIFCDGMLDIAYTGRMPLQLLMSNGNPILWKSTYSILNDLKTCLDSPLLLLSIYESLNGVIRSYQTTVTMARSASLPNEEQYLQVVNKGSENLSNHSLINVTDSSVIENILFDKVSPLYYKSRVYFSFSLSDKFKKNFVMIKGLLEFHRSRQFSFEYNFSQKTIDTDIEVSQLGDLRAFLHDVSIWLTQEIKFKETLKTILDFENQYKVARSLVYALLKK